MLILLVWAGEFFCFGVYCFIVQQSSSQPEVAAASTEQVLPVLFGAMAVALLLAGLVFRWFVFSQRRAQAFFARQKLPPANESEDKDLEEQLLIQLAKATFQPYIMSLGMINSCVLFGMVLSVIQRDPRMFMPFLCGGIVGAALCFPTLEAFIEESMQTRRLSLRRRTS